MKRFYFFLTLLFSVVGIVNVSAQEESDLVTLTISAKTGDWTASGSPAYANEYATTKQDPGVTILHVNRSGGHNNNMYFYDGENLGIYSALGSTTSENYWITPSDGWYVYGVSLDFLPGKHPNYNANGVRVWGEEDEETAVTCPVDATEPAHYEVSELMEAPKFILTIGQLAEGGNPVFALTSNFTVTLAPRDPVDVILDECDKLFNQYSEALGGYVAGTEPGCYDATAVEQLGRALDSYNDNQMSIQTKEEALSYKQAILDAIEAVETSKVIKYALPDGYYRIKTALTYVDGDGDEVDKYMKGPDPNANWGDVDFDSPKDLAESLWKITNTEGGFLIQNMSNDLYLNDGNPAPMKDEAEEVILIEPVITLEGITYFQMRTANNKEVDNKFFHQSGHSSGKGKGGNIVYWYSSYNYQSTKGYTFGGSEWMVEPVTETEAQKIITDYLPVKEREKFEKAYTALRNQAKTELKESKDIQEYNNLITDNSQFSSPWTEASEGSIEALIDGDPATFWHSAWSGGNVPNHTHYLQVELTESVQELVQIKITRRKASNDHITLWGVWGANDPKPATYWEEGDALPEGVEVGDVKEEESGWFELASLSTPFGNNTETVTSDDFSTRGCKYLRFYIDGTTTGRGYGHVSEFQIVIPVPNPTSQFANMGEAGTNLETVLGDQLQLDVTEVTQEQFDALQAAYDAFKAQFVDPAELRELLASVEGIANGVTIGTQPGYWKDASTGEALKKTWADAKAYDAAGVYVANKSNEFIETLKAQAQAVKDAVIGVETGKWYRIRFGTEAEFEAGGWEKAGEPSVSNQVQTDEALYGKYLTVASTTTETQEGVQTTKDEESGEQEDSPVDVTVNIVVPLDQDAVIYRGQNLYFDAESDIQVADYALFRFVSVGDTAFVMQNKATGLFLRAAGGSGATTLDIIPSLFRVQAIGYGQNAIAATNLVTNASQNWLHAQRSGNNLVTWNANTPGSRSGLYIEEVTDVASNYDGTAYTEAILPNEIYSRCYPVDVKVEGEDSGVMYYVSEVAIENDTAKVNLAPITEAIPGRSFIYIYDDDLPFNAESQKVDLTWRHGYDFVKEPRTGGALQGTFATKEIGAGYIVTGGNLRDHLGAHAGENIVRNKLYVTRSKITNSVVAFNSYIASEEGFSLGLDVTFEIVDAPDGIANALKNVARKGAIYTIDGQLVSKNGNLNTLRGMKKGMYIVNGTKVRVK